MNESMVFHCGFSEVLKVIGACLFTLLIGCGERNREDFLLDSMPHIDEAGRMSGIQSKSNRLIQLEESEGRLLQSILVQDFPYNVSCLIPIENSHFFGYASLAGGQKEFFLADGSFRKVLDIKITLASETICVFPEISCFVIVHPTGVFGGYPKLDVYRWKLSDKKSFELKESVVPKYEFGMWHMTSTVNYDPKSRWITLTSQDGVIFAWVVNEQSVDAIELPQEVNLIRGDASGLTSTCFSTDLRYIAKCVFDYKDPKLSEVTAWKVSTGQNVLRKKFDGQSEFRNVSFLGDQSLLVTGRSQVLKYTLDSSEPPLMQDFSPFRHRGNQLNVFPLDRKGLWLTVEGNQGWWAKFVAIENVVFWGSE